MSVTFLMSQINVELWDQNILHPRWDSLHGPAKEKKQDVTIIQITDPADSEPQVISKIFLI